MAKLENISPIKLADQRPDDYADVLLFAKKKGWFPGYYSLIHDGFYGHDDLGKFYMKSKYVTHWLPFSALPIPRGK